MEISISSENIEKFVIALERTGIADNDKRKEAETFIENEKEKPGFLQVMMHISSHPEYRADKTFDINLAAAIQLKNIVSYHWKFTTEEDANRRFDDESDEDENVKNIFISSEDKEFVKSHIIQAMSQAPSFGVLSQYEEIVHVVAKYEMPEKWPNAMTEIADLLNQEDEAKVFGGLVALKEVVHRFEFEFKERREPLQEIVDNLFPRIELIFNTLIDINTDDAVKAKNIIMQTFHLANQVKITNRYHNNKVFDSFINTIVKVLTQGLPEEYTELTNDADKISTLTKSDQWKLKTNWMKFLIRVFTQLWDPEMVEDVDLKLSKHFVKNHAKSFIELALTIIENSMNNFVVNEIISYAIRIISKTEKINHLFKIVKKHYEDILFKYCLPLLQLTPIEIEEFRDNPVVYIRNQFDIKDTLNSAKNSAIDMTNYFAAYKENDDEDDKTMPPYLEKYLNYLNEELVQYNKQENPNFKVKESIMLSLGHLSREIEKFTDLHIGVEVILKEHVFPELSGQNEMLKARALWLYGELSLFVKEPGHAVKVVEEVYKSLLDEWLPVKVFAGTSLHKLSKIKEAKEILEPGISNIIEAYLKIMQEIDQDELVNALEEIVNIFEDKVEPFAFELIEQLNIRFKKAAKQDHDPSGETILTANGCIWAIRRIIAAVSKRKDLLEKIEDEMYPSILFTLTPKGIEYTEDSLDWAILLVYHRQFISEKMWKLFIHMIGAVIGSDNSEVDQVDGGYGFEFLPIMLSFFQNWIAYGGDAFFEFIYDEKIPFQLLKKSISRVLAIDGNIGEGREASVSAMKLIGTVLENCFGKVDDSLADFIQIIYSELENKPSSKVYKSSILQTFAMCFVYNTNLTYICLEELGYTEYMLRSLFSNINNFKKTFEIRRVLYGFSSIIRSDPRNAPDLIRNEIESIINVVVFLIDAYVNSKEKEITKEIRETTQMKNRVDKGFEDDDEFRDIIAKLKEIKKKEGDLFTQPDGQKENKDDDYDGEGEFDDEDDSDFDEGDVILTAQDLELYDSPLEKVDAPIYFRNIMGELQQTIPELYELLVSMVSNEDKKKLERNFSKNEELLKLEKDDNN